jgi:hypothetical protein
MCSAIHINYRSWLRSSSTHEPSDPPHRIILCLVSKGGGGNFPPAFTPRFLPPRWGENTTASMQATRGPLRIPTRRRHRQQSEREPKVVRPTKMTNGRDERSCEDGHKRENPYTARRFFNPLPQLRRKSVESRAGCSRIADRSKACRPGPLPCRSIRPVYARI